jgi:DNA-binding GntR family transcriptional regulator
MRTQLRDEVAAYVRELITSDQVRPSEFLRIEPIAEALGVSQTPVREGLLSLQSEGIVKLLPRRGFIVAPITPQDIADLFWAQAVIAGELAARAAVNITEDELRRLSANVAQYDNALTAGDREPTPELGFDFHRELNRAARSHRLALLLDAVTANLPSRIYAAGNPKQTGHDHPQLLKALRRHDGDLARELMTKHISAQGDQLITFMRERGFWDPED